MGELPGALVWETRVSGRDSHQVLSVKAGDTLLPQYQILKKDDGTYVQLYLNGEPSGEWIIAEPKPLPADVQSFCLDPSTYDPAAEGPHRTTTVGTAQADTWADSAGRPIRIIQTEDTAVTEFTFSGYGEPNVITTPMMTPTPDEAP